MLAFIVAPNLCELEVDDCDRENGYCIDQGAEGFTCQCNEGYLTVDGAPVGRNCEGKSFVTYDFIKRWILITCALSPRARPPTGIF